MLTTLALAALLAQDDPKTDLAQQSRKLFESVIDLVVTGERLVVSRTCDDNTLKDTIGSIHSRLKLGSASWGGNSFNGRGSGWSVVVDFGSGEKSGHISMAFMSDRESLDLRQTEQGTLRLLYESGESTALLRQRKDGPCTLLVDDGPEVKHFSAPTFQELMLQQPDLVTKYVVAPLERWLDDGPLTSASPAVIEMALALQPIEEADARAIQTLLEQLEDDSLETRDAAAKDLRERAAKSVPTFHSLARRMEAMPAGEVKSRLAVVLKADARREAAYRVMVGQSLYRDLTYLAKLLAAGKPARARLEQITGQSLGTPEEWAKWVKENAPKLTWDEDKWRWRTQY